MWKKRLRKTNRQRKKVKVKVIAGDVRLTGRRPGLGGSVCQVAFRGGASGWAGIRPLEGTYSGWFIAVGVDLQWVQGAGAGEGSPLRQGPISHEGGRYRDPNTRTAWREENDQGDGAVHSLFIRTWKTTGKRWLCFTSRSRQF